MRRALVLLVAALTAGELGAQALRPTGSASLVTARVRSAVPAGIDQFTGSAFLGQGALTMGRGELSVSYLQGTLNHDGGSAAGRDLVEGTVLLGIRALDWLALGGGPQARADTPPGGTHRWLFRGGRPPGPPHPRPGRSHRPPPRAPPPPPRAPSPPRR